MKHIKDFKTFEAIIVPEFQNNSEIQNIKTYSDLLKYAEDNNFKAMTYDEFIEYIDPSDRESAPKYGSAPFFAFYDTRNDIPVFVINSENELRHPMFNMILNKEIENIIKHELIHKGQSSRSKIEYKLPSPTDKKKYLTDKNEIMAFSYSIAKSLYDVFKRQDLKDIFDNIDKYGRYPMSELWEDIKKNCDEKTIKRYKKYIYLYLEELINKKDV